jgi:hypothetical protein
MLSVRYDVYVCLCVSVNTDTYVYGLHTHAHNYIADESLCERSSWMLSVRDHTHTSEFFACIRIYSKRYVQCLGGSGHVSLYVYIHVYTYA